MAYLADGNVIELTTGTARTINDFICLPTTGANCKLVVVATDTFAADEIPTCHTRGRFSVSTKKTGVGEAWAIGDDIYLTATGDFTETSSANAFAGVAAAVSATGDTTGEILLNHGGDPR